MIDLKNSVVLPPSTYQDWLSCFEYLKSRFSVENHFLAELQKGTYNGSGPMAARLQAHLVETINQMLKLRLQRFEKDLNRLIGLNEVIEIAPLFKKFSREIQACLFFRNMTFIDASAREEMSQSLKSQISKYWSISIQYLRKLNMENNNSELEDALFLIRRIKLFPE